MRRIGNYIALIWIVLFVSCEEESLEPRTNPRFSVTIIQEISSSGVQFGADIYDFGNEEILEYGFVYSQATKVPSLSQDDFVSAQGRPGESFELTANHSMTVGKKYYVSAFLKTSTSLVFSESVEFVSQGSEGFIITSVDWPDVIYKGQKLLVKGRRFSKQKYNYKIKLGQFDLYPDLLDSNTFTVDLPIGLLTETTGQDIETELRIEINEKSYTEKRVLKFREPVFESQPLQKIDFGDEVVIKGDFFDLGSGFIVCQGQQYRDLPISKTEIRFKPYLASGFPEDGEANPILYYEIRGVRYELGRLFQLNPSYLDQKEISLKNGLNYLTGRNFNVLDPSGNQIEDQFGNIYTWNTQLISKDSIEVYPDEYSFPEREFSIRMKNYGQYSNSVPVKLSMPVVRRLTGHRIYYNNWIHSATFFNNKGYLLNNEGVFEESLEKGFENKLISDLPDQILVAEIVTSVSGMFIFGGGIDEQRVARKKLYSFSLQSKKWEQLPDLPNGNYNFSRIYQVSDGIVFEAGFKVLPIVDVVTNGEKWHLSLPGNVWTRLGDVDFDDSSSSSTFYHNGFSYSLRSSWNSSGAILERYNETLGSWNFLSQISTELLSRNIALLNNNLYIVGGEGYLVEINMSTYATKGFYHPYGGWHSAKLFSKGNSLFVIGEYSVFDVQPDKFE
jgi:hypothetical protein